MPPTTTNCGAGAWADYDADGDPDVFIRGTTSFLFRNDGPTSWVNFASGNMSAADAASWPGTAIWVDFDLDGDLDLHKIGDTGSRLFRWGPRRGARRGATTTPTAIPTCAW